MRRALVVPVVLAILGCGGAKSPAAGTAEGTAAALPPPTIRYDQHIAVEGMQPAGAELTNPFAGDGKSVEVGGKLFTAMNCDGCHGGGATGSIAPSLSDRRWRYGGSDGALYYSIYSGRPQGMPAFGGMLQEPIIWKLVTYIRSLPVPAAVPTQSW
jgi:cytochrome c oxidase cbb3-type subunit 3